MSFSGWMDRRARVESTGDVAEGDLRWALYRVGDWRMLVSKSEGAESPTLLVERDRQAAASVRRELPSLAVDEGRLSVHLEDLVQLILDRSTPEEVSRVLWVDDAVREAFMERLVDRYDAAAVADRRRFLQRIQAAVYADALDRAVDRLAELERRVRDREQAWRLVEEANRRIGVANDRLRDINSDLPEGRAPLAEIRLIPYGEAPDQHPDYRIGGTYWHDGREAWRDRLQRVLAPPEVEAGSADLRAASRDSEDSAPGRAQPPGESPF